ncbi:MAG: epimerase [Brachybacterium faecium]|nr:MAG: epimerase [Brachybacterium faecium]
MRVAVVGATGNVGTAVVQALHERPEVSSVLGIARRMPDQTAEPYSHADWASIDIGAAVAPAEAIAHLKKAFADVDAVIHLAWLIQPNSKRELLHRVNVEGTRHVALAAAAAGVDTLVVASSVGAYSPSPGLEVRDESWQTGGIPTSHYSVDKAVQEQVLDEFAAEHPEVTVTRLRPALIFSAEAASEIQRYFLGSWMPVQALKAGRPPLLPLPEGLRLQAVHAADVGAAYAAAAVTGAGGAFNICADDVLGVQELADIVGGGKRVRPVEVPPSMVRTAMSAGHLTGLVAADAGWLDMGMNVPLMDNSRAKEELGWQPTRSAADTVAELLDGMIEGAGADSVPMRPRDASRASLPAVVSASGDPARAGDGAAMGSAGAAGSAGAEGTGGPAEAGERISPVVDRELLGLYLADHLTGSAAGVSRIQRMAEANVDTPVFAELSMLADEIRTEQHFLEQIIHDLGLARRRHRQAAAWAGEKVARLKNNGVLVKRSPMTLVLEVELMRSAVLAKKGGWETLRDNAELLGLDKQVFADLVENVDRQAAVLDQVHAYARRRAFRTDKETFTPQG